MLFIAEKSIDPFLRVLRFTWSKVKTGMMVSKLDNFSVQCLENTLEFVNTSFAVDVVPKPTTLGRRSPMPLYVLNEDVSSLSSPKLKEETHLTVCMCKPPTGSSEKRFGKRI